MKTYKVMTVRNPTEAEREMNRLAGEGWALKEVTRWQNAVASPLLMLTFERDD